MKSGIFTPKNELGRNGKASAIFLKMNSELFGVYLWFLQFSNILSRLVQ